MFFANHSGNQTEPHSWEFALYYADVQIILLVAIVVFVAHTCKTKA